ncbi:MAG: DinB family protein [Candidatus Zixiibacteriota bacterium]
MPPAPASYDAILTAFEQGQKTIADIVRGLTDEALFATVKFITAPKTISDVPRLQVLWMMLCDQIHHRGQFSVYLRLADGKVPSIYGPTADEPWL